MNTATTTRSEVIASKARATVAAHTTHLLVQMFEHTTGSKEASIPVVREWIMDELESRNAEAFMAWLDSTEESPRAFFLAADGITAK